jgi:RNA polymerase sigma-70 factor (ECF subfamily)
MVVHAGDRTEFGARLETYRRELHVHCYRMMGSVQDADDMVQETFLRAWRRHESLETPASLRAWLYTIATNVCLDALKQRPRRAVPRTWGDVTSLAEPIPRAIQEPVWLEPYPDTLLAAGSEQSPEEQVTAREQITMAFIVALHRLPPRQRAVLLLREVLEWPASEVAALLDTSVAAVKSALHRARAVLAEHRVTPDAADARSLDDAAQARLAAYVRAWEAADITALVGLLKDDVVFSMPPIPAWYRGRDEVAGLMARTVFSGQAEGRWRLLPTSANGQVAFGLYRQSEMPGQYQAYGIQLVSMVDHAIGEITTFIGAEHFRHFDLPMVAPEERGALLNEQPQASTSLR